MELIVLIVVGGLVSGVVAGSKGRSVLGWVILGSLFPLIGILLVALLPSLRPQAVVVAPPAPMPVAVPPSDLVPCPHCAEPIRRAAKVCRFCNRDIETAAAAPRAKVRACNRCGLSNELLADYCARCGVSLKGGPVV